MNRQKRISKFTSFFFPLSPIKIFKSLKTMIFIATLLALRIVFDFLSIPIPGIVGSISIGIVFVMVMGWIFGPTYGIFLGMLSDTLCFLIHPTGVWFWMYAIQEPLIAMIAGIIGSLYRLRVNKIKNIIFDIIVQQIIFTAFIITCFVCLLLLTPKSNDNDWQHQYNAYRWICTILLCCFFVCMEIFTFLFLKVNWTREIQKILLFIYLTFMVLFVTIIFSIILGPIISYKYLSYINGYTPENWLNIGFIYYLMPRIVIDCFKAPIETMLIVSILTVAEPIITDLKNHVRNQWF